MNKQMLFSAVAAMLICGCSVEMETVDEPVQAEETTATDGSCFIEGELQVQFSEEIVSRIEKEGADPVMAEMADMGVYKIERLFPDAGEMEKRQRQSGLHRWYTVYYDAAAVSGTKASGEVEDRFPDAVVERPRKSRPNSVPFNDSYAYKQWNLFNDGLYVEGSAAGVDVNVVPVWKRTAGSRDVIVNVVDAGAWPDHPDLMGVVIPGGENGSRNFVDDSYNITADQHGAHVSGIIGAINNNGEGVSSIAGGSDGSGGVRIMVSQIFKENRETGVTESTGQIPQAIVWGANHGALISQNSWGYDYDSEQEALESGIPQSLKQAIDYFIKYAGCDADGNQTGLMKGGIVVFSAGNDGWSIGHPGDYEPVIAVGAISPAGRKAYYSNYGPWVDLCAPGGDYSALGGDAMVLGPVYESEYCGLQGTSMACPHVSGVAALMISLYGGAGFTCDDLKSILVDGANYSYGVTDRIGPLVDAEGAMLAYAGEERTPEIRTSYTGDYVVKGHEILEVDYSVVNTGSNPDIKVECGKGAVAEVKGRSVIMRFNDASGRLTGKYKAKISVITLSGMKAEKEIEYTILENHAPVVIKSMDDMIIRVTGTSFTLNCSDYFSDPDGGSLEYKWIMDANGSVDVSGDGSTLTVKSFCDGVVYFTVYATDPCGAYCCQSFRVGCFDDSVNGPSAYPNPVTDKLNICVGGESETSVTLYTSTGKRLKETSGKCSVLNPLAVDMQSLDPALYRVEIEYEGKKYYRDVAKI